MSDEPLELVCGSGNVFADFGHPDADLEQARAILAAKIMGVLDGHGLSTRAAARLTGVSRVDFFRIRSRPAGRLKASGQDSQGIA